ncbi:MAG: hypothetical protein JOZ22_07995, partial [Acidobacteriia bacterium]|nr:hypothetical protein [Terriglobia bacterium]
MQLRLVPALLALAIALSAQQPGPKGPPRPGVSTPGVKRELSAIHPVAVFDAASGTPDWQVLTEDSVWVTNGPRNAIHRLDVNTNQIAATITVGKR